MLSSLPFLKGSKFNMSWVISVPFTDKFNKTEATHSLFGAVRNFRIPGMAGCNLYFTWKHQQFLGQLIGFVMKNGRQPKSGAKWTTRNRSAGRLVLHRPEWHIRNGVNRNTRLNPALQKQSQSWLFSFLSILKAWLNRCCVKVSAVSIILFPHTVFSFLQCYFFLTCLECKCVFDTL